MRVILPVLFAGSIAAMPVSAEAVDCNALLGTYLTEKVDTSGVDKGITGRTILSLAKDGFATMTDSAQGGIKGYQAFGMMQGVWACKADSGTTSAFHATLVDFSYPDKKNPDAKIARVEISGEVNAGTGKLKGRTEINIFPLFDDPFSGKAPELVVTYAFEGRRVPTPAPDGK